MTDMLMSSHEREMRAKVQLMERRQQDREAIYAAMPRKGEVMDFIGDGKFTSVKKILEPSTETLALPGDDVVVEYVGWLGKSLDDEAVLEAKRQAPFDASKRFTFRLGAMSVIPGWDLGVATMRVGERALFCLAPEHAYGASGAPPVIPPNAHLLFEIKLLRADEPVVAHGLSLPQLLGGLVALGLVLYYTLFFTPSNEPDAPDL
mmetsp:Transcript_15762/g.49354  ORF Transcript_15762/g.49354 Transcript_15762/m.49354 type:complete len:205 (-) Transcript_15762:190-804(-)|eukprot:CAMPEP_0197388290 /NCGR_PEP_ID=MMETSP1165-20131217/992_1 /TAXON_ID=284809 /ORGANISM="Chrysocystis fragilis, Strain CCMP3189" /LENGTH=204 /DNA_ID=CAMNT_0042913633 /DNA_START=20 /DNA_END=634 /DNA_ORIENTATION=+